MLEGPGRSEVGGRVDGARGGVSGPRGWEWCWVFSIGGVCSFVSLACWRNKTEEWAMLPTHGVLYTLLRLDSFLPADRNFFS